MLAQRLRKVKGAGCGLRNVAETKAVDVQQKELTHMVDDPTKLHADGRRINVSQEHECRYWAEKFGVSPGELKAAVSKAGPMVEDVARALGKSDTRT
jgi:Protein of unknown function (DUF3606)